LMGMPKGKRSCSMASSSTHHSFKGHCYRVIIDAHSMPM
jgi:hypothetical protein